MAIPTYDTCIEPLLRLLAENTDGIRTTEVYEKLADHFKLTENERAELLPSGTQPVYHNRIGWAHDRIKRKGFSSSPRRGLWKATEAGIRFIVSHPRPLTTQEIQTIARLDSDKGGQRNSDEGSLRQTPPNEAMLGNQAPDERIENALKELRESVAHDLLSAIAESSPRFFETLVLDLLHALGYGTSRADVQHVGGSGDGGIDGIISLDRLGLEKVYIQAKRWGSSVGRPDIQAFYGGVLWCARESTSKQGRIYYLVDVHARSAGIRSANRKRRARGRCASDCTHDRVWDWRDPPAAHRAEIR